MAIPVETLKPVIDAGTGKIFDAKGKFSTKQVELSSWVAPGSAPRYGDEKAWRGPSKLAILLLLAPIASLFQHMRGDGDNWIMVVPEIHDLAESDDDASRR